MSNWKFALLQSEINFRAIVFVTTENPDSFTNETKKEHRFTRCIESNFSEPFR